MFFFNKALKPVTFTMACLLLSLFFSQPGYSMQTELQAFAIKHDNTQRSYYLYQPKALNKGKKRPLLLVLHGGGKADGQGLAKKAGFNQLADKYGFLVAYPNGIDSQWNDGRGRTYRQANNTRIDDVGFIDQLIDQLIDSYPVDRKRIYITGLSNGGMMTYRLACELSDKVAAVAPIIANMPKNIVVTCHPKKPLPMLIINGTQDPIVPWEGGQVHFFNKAMGEVISADETLRFWAHQNHCQNRPGITQLPDINKKDGSSVRLTRYTNSSGSCDVQQYAIVGGGHNFPGSTMLELKGITGRKNMDINAATIIWEFLSKQTR